MYFFVAAGADLIITNTYQASVGGFVQYLGINSTEALALIYKAVELAKQAREIFLEEYPDRGIRTDRWILDMGLSHIYNMSPVVTIIGDSHPTTVFLGHQSILYVNEHCFFLPIKDAIQWY